MYDTTNVYAYGHPSVIVQHLPNNTEFPNLHYQNELMYANGRGHVIGAGSQNQPGFAGAQNLLINPVNQVVSAGLPYPFFPTTVQNHVNGVVVQDPQAINFHNPVDFVVKQNPVVYSGDQYSVAYSGIQKQVEVQNTQDRLHGVNSLNCSSVADSQNHRGNTNSHNQQKDEDSEIQVHVDSEKLHSTNSPNWRDGEHTQNLLNNPAIQIQQPCEDTTVPVNYQGKQSGKYPHYNMDDTNFVVEMIQKGSQTYEDNLDEIDELDSSEELDKNDPDFKDTDVQDQSSSSESESESRAQVHKCKTCGKIFPKLYLLQRHLKTHELPNRTVFSGSTAPKPNSEKVLQDQSTKAKSDAGSSILKHECEICGKAFTRRYRLNRHLKTHGCSDTTASSSSNVQKPHAENSRPDKCENSESSAEKHKCGVCGKVFPRRYSLTRHLKTHKRSDDVVCPSSAIQKVDAIQTQSGGKVFDCKICGKLLTSQSKLLDHVMMHAGDKRYTCEICKKGFIDRINLLRHKKSHGVSEEFVCNVCGKKYSTKYSLTKHTRIHVEKQQQKQELRCEICDQLVVGHKRLEEHLMKAHSIAEQPYTCQICCQTFTHQSTCIAHQSEHQGATELICAICCDIFTEPKALAQHAINHMKKVQCKVCGKKLSTETLLKAHEKAIHSKLQVHKCRFCSNTFVYHRELVEHRKKHASACSACGEYLDNGYCKKCKETRLPPWKQGDSDSHLACSAPSSSFCSVGAFNVEIRLICDTCNKSFQSYNDLTLHKKTHEGAKNFKCKTCGKGFSNKSSLRLHEEFHDG